MYEWLRAFHIIAVIAWMAGLFYLPRLMVYHCRVPVGSDQDQLFQLMERKLRLVIMLPASIATWALGLWLLWQFWDMYKGNGHGEGWLHAKLTLVAALTWYHHLLARWSKAFVTGQNRHSERFFRIINEVPTVLMIGIVIMVIVRPF